MKVECPNETGAAGAVTRPEVKCFNCGRMGHIIIKCPNKALFCSE